MKRLMAYINESLSQETKELQKKLKKFDLSRIFNGKYDLDDSLPEEFIDLLKSFDRNPKDSTLKSTWRMLYSKTCIEPTIGKIFGECTYSSIKQDRKEKWDIKYDRYIIDVKATYNDTTKNFSISSTDIEHAFASNDENRYFAFVAPEMKTWEDAKKYARDVSKIRLYMISFSDFKEVIDTNEFKSEKKYTLIPEKFMESNDKFIGANTTGVIQAPTLKRNDYKNMFSALPGGSIKDADVKNFLSVYNKKQD